ncbi:unnamed protein product [Rhodiola kirilowii]
MVAAGSKSPWLPSQFHVAGYCDSDGGSADCRSSLVGRSRDVCCQNRATIRNTRLQLQTMKKRDLPAAEYYQRMKALADTLASIGAPLKDDELIDYILAGLGPQFGPLAASLTIVNKTVTLTDFYAYLLSFEAMQAQHDQSDDWLSSANTVARHNPNRRSVRSDTQNGRDRRNSQLRPHNQPDGGHTGSRSGGGRNRHGGGRPRPRCQICHIFGHDALSCHNRFNEAYTSDEIRSGNIADRRTSSDGQWYLDSGATDHLTAELDRLTLQEKYTGHDKIQAANGAGQGNKENPVPR